MGWRTESLRIVLVLTDAGFKTALDGKVCKTSYMYVYILQAEKHSTGGFCITVNSLV